MASYLLRIEGVNLSNFVYDTQDLCTIRGGGLLLLEAVKKIHDRPSIKPFNLSPVTNGASSGIFEFQAVDDNTGASIRDKIDHLLRTDQTFKHATFVVDYVPDTGDFVHDRELLMTRNRVRQLQSPTLAYPTNTTGPGRTEICPRDLIRPGLNLFRGPKGAEMLSESVDCRRNYGKQQKQGFYAALTGQKFGDFAGDFAALSEAPYKGNLSNKMAVIYVDGNRFGRIQTTQCRTNEDQKNWDNKIQGYRKDLLTALLAQMQNDTDWINPGDPSKGNSPVFRLETLLWGGDEIIWVVPAWKGWKTLEFFFEHVQTNNWRFDDQALEHAAGIVFCHNNAPIDRVVELAKKLAEKAKEKSRETSLFSYQVLESFDHVGASLDEFMKIRTRSQQQTWLGSGMVLQGKAMKAIREDMLLMREGFPKGKVHDLAAVTIEKGMASTEFTDLEKRACMEIEPGVKTAWTNLKSHLGDTVAMQVADLWDYMV